MGDNFRKFAISISAARNFVLIISILFGIFYFFYQPYLYDTYTITTLNKKSSSYNTYTNDLFNHKCGVILFFHIPKTGGGSVLKWLNEHTTVLNTYSMIRRDKKYSMNNKNYETLWKNVILVANQFLSDMSPTKGWKAIHLHHLFPGMYYNQDIVGNWRTIVESKGCVLHKTTILRDPLDRFVSAVNYLRTPLNQVDYKMNIQRNQLSRYILFGTCWQQDNDIKCHYTSTKDRPYLNHSYVLETTKIINKFDSIGFLDKYDEYLEIIRKVTGWKEDNTRQTKKKKVHQSQNHLSLTSDRLKKFLMLNQEDYLFYYNLRKNLSSIYQLNKIV